MFSWSLETPCKSSKSWLVKIIQGIIEILCGLVVKFSSGKWETQDHQSPTGPDFFTFSFSVCQIACALSEISEILKILQNSAQVTIYFFDSPFTFEYNMGIQKLIEYKLFMVIVFCLLQSVSVTLLGH